MFFKTNADIQNILPVSTGFTLKNFTKYLKQGDFGFIIRELIGKETYNVLLEAYTTNTYENDEQELAVYYLQVASAFYAYAIYLPFSGTQSSDAGLMVVDIADTRIAYQWKEIRTQTQAYKVAYEYAEYLLAHLEENIDTFPAFEASKYFTIHKTSLLKNVTDFSDFVNINQSRLLFKRLQRPIKLLQDKYLPSFLGNTLASQIIAELTDDSLTEDKEALLPYLKAYLAHFVFAENVGHLPLEFDNNGFYLATPKNQVNNTNDKTIPDNHLVVLKTQHENKAKAAQKELIDFLHANLTTYPSFVTESKFYRKPSANISINSADSKNFFF